MHRRITAGACVVHMQEDTYWELRTGAATRTTAVAAASTKVAVGLLLGLTFVMFEFLQISTSSTEAETGQLVNEIIYRHDRQRAYACSGS